MDIQTQPLSSFEFQSNSPFSYSLNASSDIHSDHFQSSQTSDSSSPVTQAPEHSEPHVGDDDVSGMTSLANGRKASSMPSYKMTAAGGRGSLGPALDSTEPNALDGACPESTAAVKLQKVYRSYRTRRKLADSAVVVEELWWQAIDYVRLNHSTISFFNVSETVASRWSRVKLNASKVGKGLSKDAKAQKLAFQHWIEAIDPRHRYGHNLHKYYLEWCKTDAGQPFFYWLDVGDGKDLDLKDCPRSKLRKQCIKYLGPQEREHYEYIVDEGKIIHKLSGDLLHTYKNSETAKWIFVASTSEKLYAGEKKKGLFHHSSFLAGGATLAAGRLEAEHGILKSVSAYSGHYKPTDEVLDGFLSYLKRNGVNLDEVMIFKPNEDSDIYEDGKLADGSITAEVPSTAEIPQPREAESSVSEGPRPEALGTYKRTLSGGLQSPRAEVPKKAILHRINSKKAAKSFQLGHQLSLKWSTGAGPRIGCVADYPVELRVQALEMLDLSPRLPPTPSYRQIGGLVSPLGSPHLASTGTNSNASPHTASAGGLVSPLGSLHLASTNTNTNANTDGSPQPDSASTNGDETIGN